MHLVNRPWMIFAAEFFLKSHPISLSINANYRASAIIFFL
jgi:hypothetical protein